MSYQLVSSMRTAVFILLPWLLLPLSWGLNSDLCVKRGKTLSDKEIYKLNRKYECKADWPEGGPTKMRILKGFVRRVADLCHGKDNWKGNNAAAQCVLDTLTGNQCDAYELEESAEKEGSSSYFVFPYEQYCLYYEEKTKEEENETVIDSDVRRRCRTFQSECQFNYDKEVPIKAYSCGDKYSGIEISDITCPDPAQNEFDSFVKNAAAQCGNAYGEHAPTERRKCLFNAIVKHCPKVHDSLEKSCFLLGTKTCRDFSRECAKILLPPTTTTLPLRTTTEPTTFSTPSTTAKATTASSTTRELYSNETTTQPIGPSSSSGIPSTTSSATTSTIVETTPEPTTVATTTEPTTEPTTVITTEAATTTTIKSTTKSTTEPTTEAPTTTESITSPATTPTSGTNPPLTTATTSKTTKKQEPIAPPVQPLITTNPSEDATPIPDPDLSDARQSGSQSGSQGAATDEEGTNLTPLYAVLGVLAVVLAVVGGIVALVIVRKRRNKKRNEGVESGLNTSKSVNLKGKKKPQPPKAPPAKAKVNAKAKNNTNKGSHKEANAENPDQMAAGSLDGFRKEGRLVMDVGIHKGELVEHATKDDDGKEIGHVVIDPTLNYMVDIGDDVELVITEEGQEDGGRGEAAKKKTERKSAKEKKSEAKSTKEKSGAKSAAKSTAGT